MKYFIFIFFSIFLNGEFVKSVNLQDVKFINFIDVSYANGIQKQSIKIGSSFLENEIVFSEMRQDMLLGSFILKHPEYVNLLKVRYIDSYGNNKTKLVYVDKGSILSSQLYFYEKGDYFYKNNKVKQNLNVKTKDNIIFEDNLPMSYKDTSTFIDISFNKCSDDGGDCDDMKFSYWDKRVIFYFTFKTINDKKMNLSKNIKRIQIINKLKNKYPTWVIVEAKENIKSIQKLDSNSDKNIIYRIYFD